MKSRGLSCKKEAGIRCLEPQTAGSCQKKGKNDGRIKYIDSGQC